MRDYFNGRMSRFQRHGADSISASRSMAIEFSGDSFSGRTEDLESSYVGSIPTSPTSFKAAVRCVQALSLGFAAGPSPAAAAGIRV
jgi:hypothetical protein